MFSSLRVEFSEFKNKYICNADINDLDEIALFSR
jgi:hypothetical protein